MVSAVGLVHNGFGGSGGGFDAGGFAGASVVAVVDRKHIAQLPPGYAVVVQRRSRCSGGMR